VGHTLTHKLDIEKLRTLLDGRSYGHTIQHHMLTHSTQDIAAQLLREGAADGLLVLAESQTAGRGRHGRAWFSPEGTGIYMSVLLKARVPGRYAPQLTIVAAAALCRVLRRLTDIDIRMKWPNDLYAEDRKISGILIESYTEAGKNRFILGAGISVNVLQEQYPEWLQDKATSLRALTGKEWDRERIIADFLTELDALIELYLSEGFRVFRTIWETYAWAPQHPIDMDTPRGIIRVRQHAIDEDGALVVQLEDGSYMTVYSGSMSVDRS